MMIASEADARLTLVSVTPPTPRSMTRSSTSSSIWMPSRASSSASTVPELSPLRIRFSWLVSFSADIQVLQADPLAGPGGQRVALARAAPVGDLAGDAVLVDDQEVVAGAGHRREADDLHRPRRVAPLRRPRRARRPCGGHDRRRRRPRSESPTRSVPRWMSTVATGPRPRSRCASMATPWASMSGLARRSSAASAVSSTASSQRLDVGAVLRRDVDEHGVAAEVLGDQAVLGELRPDLVPGRRPPCRSC